VLRVRPFVAALFLLVAAGACSEQPASNYRPPAVGVPAAAADVTGIYRTIHQGLLQLRANGDLNLIVPDAIGATVGNFTLREGAATVRTQNCGEQEGSYTIEVVPGPVMNKSTLVFTAVDDPCGERRKYLTIDPWVYADS